MASSRRSRTHSSEWKLISRRKAAGVRGSCRCVGRGEHEGRPSPIPQVLSGRILMPRSTSPSKHRRVPPGGYTGHVRAAVTAVAATLALSLLVVASQRLAAEPPDLPAGSGVAANDLEPGNSSGPRVWPNTTAPSSTALGQAGAGTADRTVPVKPVGSPAASSNPKWPGLPSLQSLPASCWPTQSPTTTPAPPVTSDPRKAPQAEQTSTDAPAPAVPQPAVPQPATALSSAATSTPPATTTVGPPQGANC